MKSLALFLSLGLFMQFLALSAQFALNRNDRGLGRWAWGSLSLSLGLAVSFFRDSPSLVSVAILGNNIFIVLGLILLFSGIRRFLGEHVRALWFCLFFLLVVAVAAVFTLGRDDPTVRRINLSMAVSLLSGRIAYRLVSCKDEAIRSPRIFLAFLFGFHSLVWLLRAVLAAIFPMPTLFSPVFIEVATYLETFVASTLWTFGFILMVNQRLRSQIDEEVRGRRRIFETIPDAVAIVRLGDRRFVDCNDGFCAMTAYPQAEVLGKSTAELGLWCRPEDSQAFLEVLAAKGSCEAFEAEFRRKDGQVFKGEVSATVTLIGGVQHYISVTHDITARRESEARIKELVLQLEVEKSYAERSALTDGLTHIPNRKRFDEVLHTEFLRHKRTLDPFSVIMIDIDHFKSYNDRYGHVAGDECLKQVARALSSSVGRPPDLVCRYGGEEFVVILPQTDCPGGTIVAARLRAAVEDLGIPHEASPSGKVVTVSLGLACVDPTKALSPEAVVKSADGALYLAKSQGRNRFVIAPPEEESSASPSGLDEGFIRLQWSPNYECVNRVIDTEHKALFEDSNRLLAAVVGGASKKECLGLLSQLLAAVTLHFRDEEFIIAAAGFPGVVEHARLHAELGRKATAMAAKFEAEELDINELLGFLAVDVISQHMFLEDRKYFPYI